jgi:hypothetical protein
MSKPFKQIKSLKLGWDSQLTFGKHIGYTVEEVWKDRPEYICWLVDNTEIKFQQYILDAVDKQFPYVDKQESYIIPVDVAMWQNTNHWDDDIPF